MAELCLWSAVLPLQLEFNLAGAHISLVESPWLIVGLSPQEVADCIFKTLLLYIFTHQTLSKKLWVAVFLFCLIKFLLRKASRK